MIFEDEETGVRVVVVQHDEKAEYKDQAGEWREVVTKHGLETEAGQSCRPWSDDDHHDLRAVRLFTDRSVRKLVRVD